MDKKEKIEYYEIEIVVNLFHYDNNPTLASPRLYLSRKKKNKRFKTRKEAEECMKKLIKNTSSVKKNITQKKELNNGYNQQPLINTYYYLLDN